MQGLPDNSENKMKSVTKSELEEKIRFIDERSKSQQPGTVKLLDYKYCYFMPEGNEINIPACIDYIIPISMKNYGFSDSRAVKLDKSENENIFSFACQQRYDKFFENDSAALNLALETIAGCVNDSFEFDIHEIEESINSRKGGFDTYTKELIDIFKSAGYKPTGDETMKGTCTESGNVIRNIINNRLIDDNLRYLKVNTLSQISSHDTTLIFDITGGGWAVVNSKSPLKPYNLVPKEKLEEIGIPFCRLKGPLKGTFVVYSREVQTL
jgi:hypothetical protein